MNLTIIIPVYNSEKTIVSCLDSIVSQSELPLEVIAIFAKKSIDFCKKYSSFKELKAFLLNLSKAICNFYQNQLHGIDRYTSIFFPAYQKFVA